MSAWVLVPCLVALRNEYNAVAPGRDKGSDGSIGDSAHTSSSDHTPDEDSDVLRDHDADSKNEVHALDIDSTGPWPETDFFDARIEGIVFRHRHGLDDRLKYIIWNRQIASASWGWTWRTYTGTSDPHTGHAHFSAQYTTTQENDTSYWGVESEIPVDQDTFNTLMNNWAASTKGKTLIATAVLKQDGIIVNGDTTTNADNPYISLATAANRAQVGTILGYTNRDLINKILAVVAPTTKK